MRAPIIEIADLSFAWPDRVSPTLLDMDWHVNAGEFALVIGRSGSGKSTMLRTLNGLVPHFSGGAFGGRVLVNDRDTRVTPPRDMARHVGFVFQDPESQLLTSRVVDDIAFSMEQLAVSPIVMRKRVEEMLDLVSIAHLRDRDPSTLSGGERQRVAIAAALALHPQVLVLDEPTSQLDPWGAEEVIAALTRMNNDLGLTVVMSEHRLERVLDHADTVRLLDDKGVPTDSTPAEIAHRVAAVALPPITQIARALDWPLLPLTVKQARQHPRFVDLRALVRDKDPAPESSPSLGRPLLELVDLSVSLGGQRVVNKVSLTVREGELVALMGRNGSGKTTLLRSIMGFIPETEGRMIVDHQPVQPNNPTHADIAYVPQRSSSLFFRETLIEEFHFTAHKRGVQIDARQLLADLNLAWAADRHPSSLSVGERQRAAIAVVLAGSPKILLLDEPTRGMDPWHRGQLAAVLGTIRSRGVGILMATHDVELVAQIAQTVLMLGDGGVVAAGPPDAVLTDSLTYSTQVNKLLGNRWLSVDQVLAAVR